LIYFLIFYCIALYQQFVLDLINDSLMEDVNVACIACHTRVGVNITLTKNVHQDFTAEENETGVWTFTNFGGCPTTQKCQKKKDK
jgi:hypothetical protein